MLQSRTSQPSASHSKIHGPLDHDGPVTCGLVASLILGAHASRLHEWPDPVYSGSFGEIEIGQEIHLSNSKGGRAPRDVLRNAIAARPI